MKLKVKSSDRIKRRYLLLEGKDSGRDRVEKVVLDYIGILGWARAKPVFVNGKGKTILAIERKSLNEVRAGFELCKEDIKIVRVSGTLKGLGE